MTQGVPNYWSKEWLEREYVNKNRTKKDIVNEHGVSPRTIQNKLNEHEIRKRTEDRKYRDEKWLRENYLQKGCSAGRLAEMADCSKTTILDYLDKYGIETRGQNE